MTNYTNTNTITMAMWGNTLMNKNSKQQASYKASKAQVKRATRELRNKRKGGKRIAWGLTA
jgi:NAD(P)-dependent dehydrogenase (short-subunit alcohol dehydrogenase family)